MAEWHPLPLFFVSTDSKGLQTDKIAMPVTNPDSGYVNRQKMKSVTLVEAVSVFYERTLSRKNVGRLRLVIWRDCNGSNG